MNKLCKTCNYEKPYDSTAKPRSKASGFYYQQCWTCYIRKVTPVLKPYSTAPCLTVEERNAQLSQASCRWAKKYPAKSLARNARYRASKLQRTPKWADHDAIAAWYEAATAFGFEVDHIVPLKGKFVSGLHVHNNLQLLTKSENCEKGNQHA
jgi:hypothetical protein